MPSMQRYHTRKVWQKGLNDRMAQCSLGSPGLILQPKNIIDDEKSVMAAACR